MCSRRMRDALLGLLSAVTAAAPALAEPAQQRITREVRIGPYRIGMTPDEILAAAPAADWETDRLEGGKVRLLRSDEGLLLADQRFEVVIVPNDEYGAYALGFNSRTMIQMDACQKNFLAVVAEMEKQLGLFSPSSEFAIPPARNVIVAGQKSTVQVDRDRRNGLWDAVRVRTHPHDGYHVQLHAHFNSGRSETAGCFISADIRYEPATVL